jgi:hypothetical protein
MIKVAMQNPARRSPNSRDTRLHAWRGLPDIECIVEQSRVQRDETCAELLLQALRRLRRMLMRQRKRALALASPALRDSAMLDSRAR